jgi:mRNA interferase RelE/StbE
MHRVEYSKSALKALRKMPRTLSVVIQRKIHALAENPYGRHNNAAKLQGREGYRLRVGDWRVLYEIYDNKLVIVIIDIKPRGSVYQ